MKCFRLAPARSAIPGYRETRRHLLVAAPALLAGVILSPRKLIAAVDDAQSNNVLDEFISDSEAMAAALKRDDTPGGQDAYVAFLADAVTRVKQVSRDSLSASSWKGFDPGVYLGEEGRNRAFFIVHFELDPGAFLPPHCHPRTSVCTLGLEGSSILRHFTAEDSAPDYQSDRDTEFLIQETKRLQLQAGTVSTLTEHRDNIHLFEASEQGARGIDVTTDYGGDGSFSFLNFDRSNPVERGSNFYSARWIGSDI